MELSYYAIISMILIGFLGAWAASKLSKELQRSYPSQWEELGKPVPFSPYSIKHDFRWIGFIVFWRFNKLGSRKISALGNVVFICGVLNLAIVISWFFIPHGVVPLTG
jgi:hypothetical protein